MSKRRAKKADSVEVKQPSSTSVRNKRKARTVSFFGKKMSDRDTSEVK